MVLHSEMHFNAISSAGIFAFSIFMYLKKVGSIQTKMWKSSPLKYVSFSKENRDNVLVVDCTHPTADQLTHHLKKSGQKKLMDLSVRGDSSTDSVINAISNQHPVLDKNKFVCSNHFDIDSFLSIWCCLHPSIALEFEEVLRECAKIGDFRELRLENENQKFALQLACWINSEERRLFYRPFESTISSISGEEDEDVKFEFFLKEFESVLRDPKSEKFQQQWKNEYDRVTQEYHMLNSLSNQHDNVKVSKFPSLGLVVIECPNPCHYYSLFSVTSGYDIVLSCYSNNRYELELKYTTYVDLESRPCLPRVEIIHLVEYLNKRENNIITSVNTSATSITDNNIVHNNKPLNAPDKIESSNKFKWAANRITDTGPILRMDRDDYRLNKAERYGHPFERPIYSSSIPQQEFIETVLGFFGHAYRFSIPTISSVEATSFDASLGPVEPKKDWEWSELHDFNRAIDWKKYFETRP